jgi:predicted DNA-binding transcriptional regulator AlpA
MGAEGRAGVSDLSEKTDGGERRMSDQPDKILVAAKEAAEMLSMGRSTFWKAVKEKQAPAPVKLGGLTRWRVADLRQHVQAMPTTSS